MPHGLSAARTEVSARPIATVRSTGALRRRRQQSCSLRNFLTCGFRNRAFPNQLDCVPESAFERSTRLQPRRLTWGFTQPHQHWRTLTTCIPAAPVRVPRCGATAKKTSIELLQLAKSQVSVGTDLMMTWRRVGACWT